MTLQKITDAIWKILQVEVGDQPTLLPFLLDTYNEVRKEAEGRHDFKLAERFGYLTVPASGASWLTMQPSFSNGAPSGTAFGVKSMLRTLIYDTSSATWFHAIQRTAEVVLDASAKSQYEGTRTYGAPFNNRNLVIRTGSTLEVSGATETKQLKVLCQSWLNDWTDAESPTENPDFFIQHCSSYLKWASILAMNKFEQTFVMRAEGNLTEQSIRTQIENAWDAIVTWDSYQHASTDSGLAE